jgi:hypothetical protein
MGYHHAVSLALALCLVAAFAGCTTLAGSPAGTAQSGTPTSTDEMSTDETPTRTDSIPTTTPQPSTGTPALDLPSGVGASDVIRFSSLSTSERATFRTARNASGYVELGSDSALETFSSHRYVSVDGRLWAVQATYGRVAYYASTTELSENETVVDFGNLTAASQRRFQRVVNRSGSYVLGPNERPIDFPDPVRYDGEVYVVERGTASSAYGVVHVSPYDSATETFGE